MSPFSEAIYGTWKFRVHLGAVGSAWKWQDLYSKPAVADSPFAIELMANDGVAIAEYLRCIYINQKVILMEAPGDLLWVFRW